MRVTRSLWYVAVVALLLASLCGCGASAPTPTPLPSEMPVPSATPTVAPAPTHTQLPPTPFPLPMIPSASDQPATFTVCLAGCDFATVQAAIDNASAEGEAIIEIREPVHTEAGIIVHRDVVLRGLGAGQTVLQAHEIREEAPDRVFLVEREVSAVFERLTIRHGKPADQDENGGGIRNFGTLTLRDCTVSDNRANGGGGISNSGDLTLIDSTVQGNLADGVAPMGLECGNGGGIQCGSGTLMLLNTTISGNQAGFKGRARGGGAHIGCGCSAVMINSTISNNEASRESGREYAHGYGHGGGVYVAGELVLIHSTISENRASGEGGGIFVGKRLHYSNTIVANNVGKGGECVLIDPDAITELIGTNTYNWVEDGSCGAACTGDPMLGPLADNGGSTETHALLPGSPAVDVVPADYCTLVFDQRGQRRPASVSSAPALCDVGAFEYQP
jgi:hypothetical protein